MFVKGRLKDGVTYENAAANMRLLGKRLQTDYQATNRRFDISTIPTKDVHIHPVADRMLKPIALALMLVVGLVLVIACANVASMLLARASGRQKEIGIRLAIGASRRRLVQQLLVESVVMASLGASAGVALAWLLTQVAMSVSLPIPIPLSFALRLDGRVLLFTAVVTMIAAVVAGLAPALKATRPNLVNELKSDVAGTQAGGRRWTLRDGLVATQIAVTTVLLVAAGLLTRSLVSAQHVSIGFRTGGLAIVSTEMNMLGYDATRSQGFFDRALERVRAIPGVESAALAERLPFSINYNRNNVFLPGLQGPDDKGLVLDVARVSPEYFATLGIPIVLGRNFAPTDTPKSPGVVIVNEAMVRKYWPNEDPIGRRFRPITGSEGWFTVVGVVPDYRHGELADTDPIAPCAYVSLAYGAFANTGLTVRAAGDPASLTTPLREAIRASDSKVAVFQAFTMEEVRARGYWEFFLFGWMFSMFGGVALALAAIGVYGVLSYSVAQRTQEIGVRVALGAGRMDVLRLVVVQGVRLAVTGVVIGAIGSFFTPIIQSQLFSVSSKDPASFIGVSIFLIAVACVASYVPARRATAVDPLVALRSE
jgi:putative ABC transport system permease protein